MSGAAAGNGRQYAAPGNMLLTAGNMLQLAICCCRLCCHCEIQHAANCRQYAAPGCEIQHAANGRQYAAAGNMLLPLELSLRDSICCCRLCCRCEIQDAAAACVVAARFNMLLTAGNMLQLAARFNMLLAAGNMRISQLLLLHYFLYRV